MPKQIQVHNHFQIRLKKKQKYLLFSFLITRLSLKVQNYILTLKTLLPETTDFKDIPGLENYFNEAEIRKRIEAQINDDLTTRDFEYGLIHSLCIWDAAIIIHIPLLYFV